ncbi:uncharacterized protein G2W53_018019 [Senna tora]|uniref:Uncharacterized protein n=1 Tax=Senna tora TaxID=362788 RepID=A0A834TV41_9FABA|nr:uncharacterized protein G2W53_018019 [Senna tora]
MFRDGIFRLQFHLKCAFIKPNFSKQYQRFHLEQHHPFLHKSVDFHSTAAIHSAVAVNSAFAVDFHSLLLSSRLVTLQRRCMLTSLLLDLYFSVSQHLFDNWISLSVRERMEFCLEIFGSGSSCSGNGRGRGDDEGGFCWLSLA